MSQDRYFYLCEGQGICGGTAGFKDDKNAHKSDERGDVAKFIGGDVFWLKSLRM
jgi:hypothetical protein